MNKNEAGIVSQFKHPKLVDTKDTRHIEALSSNQIPKYEVVEKTTINEKVARNGTH